MGLGRYEDGSLMEAEDKVGFGSALITMHVLAWN
jgi:hypothetical protein